MQKRKVLVVRSIIASCLLSMFWIGGANAQSPSAQEVESLRHAVQEQQAQIRQLQLNLQEQQAKQQQLLETLQQKLERRDQGLSSAVANNQEASRAEPIPDQTLDVQPHGVQAGFGRIKFNGLLQAWYYSGDTGFDDTFRIRRTELKFTGEVNPQVKWTAMIDPSKGLSLNNTVTTLSGTPVLRETSVNQGSRILQDAFITLGYFKHLSLNIGQFKIPLSLEGLQSSAGLDTERALFASDRVRGGSYGDIRDIGVMAYGPISSQLDYQLGVFNGSGDTQNDLDRNDQKAVAGRLVYKPAVAPGLQLGASGVWGNGERAERPRRDRLGAELLYQRGPLTLKGEYMTGKDGPIARAGYYAHFAWHFTPQWEAIARYDTWDPDTADESTAVSVTERDYIAGFNYFIDGSHVKLQFNYVRKTFENDLIGPFNQAVLRLQTWW